VRILVLGSLPPPERARSLALRTEVAQLLAEGHTVEVVSPYPVATAHRYLGATGLPGCLQLWTIVAGFDSVVVQLQPGLPVRAKAGHLERALSLMAFSLALARGRHVVIRLESPDDLPGGARGSAANRFWQRAERIVVNNEDQRAAFVAEIGKRAERLNVVVSRCEKVDDEEGGWGDGSDASIEDVLALVRRRAARERRGLASADTAHFAGWDRLASPGLAMTEADTALLRTTEAERKPADLARRALAAADRRPSLWRLARAARLARRGVYALLRPNKAD